MAGLGAEVKHHWQGFIWCESKKLEPHDRIKLHCLSIDSIADMKVRLLDLLGVPVDAQTLNFADKELDNSRTLQDYGIGDGDVVTLKRASLRFHDQVRGYVAKQLLMDADPDSEEYKFCNDVLQKYQTRIIQDLNSQAIVMQLYNDDIIPETVRTIITKADSVEEANGILYDHLRHQSNLRMLNKFAGLLAGVPKAYARMQEVGNKLLKALKDSPSV